MTPAWIGLLRSRRWVAMGIVTATTLVLIGGVVLVTTDLGCGPANQFAVKLSRCALNGKATANNSPAPLFIPSPPAKGGPAATPITYYPPASSPTTSYPPNAPPGSSGQQPQVPFYPVVTGAAGYPTLSCSLPVYAGPPGSGGFVSFPGGGFTVDPRSAVTAPSPGPQQGMGSQFATTYDRAHSRWLPVSQQFVSPDGNHYAYVSGTAIYVVDAASNTQVVLGDGRSWSLLRVLNDRLYATVVNAPGLWSVPFSGSPVQVTPTGFWQAATASYAYGSVTSGVPQGATQDLLRLDISTGKTGHWFSVPGATVSVVTFDSDGNAVLQTNGAAGWELWLTTAPDTATDIANSNEFFYIQGPMVADSHGIWFPVYVQFPQTQGLALYVRGSGIYLVSTLVAQIAGACA